MTSDLVPWLVAGGLAVVVVVLVIVLRRNQSSSRTALADAEVRFDNRIGTLEREQRERAEAVDTRHAHELTTAEAARQQALADAEAARASVRRGWAAGRNPPSGPSTARAGVDGVLFTNVVFAPVAHAERDPGRGFVAQLDHVLVLESGHVLVIENKSWNGIVFDGRRPSAVHKAFRNLLDESALTGSFAVQVVSQRTIDRSEKIEHWWKVRVQSGGASPARQVRRQARRLKHFLSDEDGAGPSWVHSAVFYSGDAVAYVEPEDRNDGETAGRGATTAIVTDSSELQTLIGTLLRRNAVPNRARTDDVVRKLLGQGAHAVTLGTYRLPELRD